MVEGQRIRFTKHAKEKLGVRQIEFEMVKEVLDKPRHRFYDTLRSIDVVAKRVTIRGEAVTLVMIYTKRDGDHHIITVYSSKHFEEEFDRKVKSRRWVIIKGGAYGDQLRQGE